VAVRGDIAGITGATIVPIDMTGMELETKAKIEIGTGIAMTTGIEGTHGEIGRI